MKFFFNKNLLILPFFLFVSLLCYAETGIIKIAGQIDNSINAEQMTVSYWDNLVSGYSGYFTGEKIVKSEIDDNGYFLLRIETEKPCIYLRLGWEYDDHGSLIGEGEYQQYLFVGEVGDDIVLGIECLKSGYNLSFSGIGAAKYSCKNILAKRYKALQDDWSILNEHRYSIGYRSWQIQKNKDLIEYFIKEQLSTLATFKNELTAFAYNVYQTDVISDAYMMSVGAYESLLRYPPSGESETDVREEVKKNYEEDLSKLENLTAYQPREYLRASAYFSDCKLGFAKVRARLEKERLVNEIEKESDKKIRDKMFVSYFIVSGKSLAKSERDSLFYFISKEISDLSLLGIVTNFEKGSGSGVPVYDFSLPDIDGKLVKLSDFKGKIVFVDFWFVGCAGCSGYHHDVVRPVKQYYKEIDEVVFVTISIDRDRDKWIKGVKSGKYTTEQAVNLQCPDGNKNPVIKQLNINGYPQPLLIDRQGSIFMDSKKELRDNGVNGLIANIERARKVVVAN